MITTHFSNKYGSVTFALVTEVLPLRTIYGSNLDPGIMFDIETAEKIALITDNHRIQLSPYKGKDGYRLYVVLHDSPSTVAVARIETLNYTGGNPAQEIQDARRYDSPVW